LIPLTAFVSNVVDGFNPQKTIVIDAGIATEDNLEIIKRKQAKIYSVLGII